MPFKYKNKKNQYNKKYHSMNKDRILATKRKHYSKLKSDFDRMKESKENRLKVKIKVMQHYSNGLPRCLLCNETDLIVLSIDHINGGGAKHKRTINKRGHSFYQWLINNKFPIGYRVLCMNCQFREKQRLLDLKSNNIKEFIPSDRGAKTQSSQPWLDPYRDFLD